MNSHENACATHRHHDSRLGCDVVKLLPNEYYVTGEDIVLSTVLGSCVAACIRDAVAGLGGMNHFMLPGGEGMAAGQMSMRYGAHAMEVLINELIKRGARRERLEAKVFGGGAVLDNMTSLNIGERNADFVLRYLATEQVSVVASDLRGVQARRVLYYPRSGRAMVRRMSSTRGETEQVIQREAALRAGMGKAPARPRLELFGLPGQAVESSSS